MNPDTFEGQWTHVQGEIASWWDKLTAIDLETVTGKKDTLVAVVQEKYQYTRERAQQEVDQRLQEYSDKLGASGASRVIDMVQETAQNVASNLAETAGEVKAHAAAAASTAATAVTDAWQEPPHPSKRPRRKIWQERSWT